MPKIAQGSCWEDRKRQKTPKKRPRLSPGRRRNFIADKGI